MYQFRLSTLLLTFVVVWSSLVVFGAGWGIPAAALLLAVAAYIRSAPSMWRALIYTLFVAMCGLCPLGLPLLGVDPGAAHQAGCGFRLEEIGVALLRYERANGRLPPAIAADKQGNTMPSWRTLILPDLEDCGLPNPEYRAVYDKYSFREPWNGPNNSKLAAEPFCAFSCSSDLPIGGGPMTSYVAVTGPGTVWNDHRSAGPPRVMVVEVAESNIHWMEPRDLTLEEACRGVGEGPGPGISSHHRISGRFFFHDETGANAVFSDGSVWFIPAGLPPETLRGLFTGDEKACEEYPLVHSQRINWTNCAALVVLTLSYAVLLFHTRKKRSSTLPPAPSPPAASGGN